MANNPERDCSTCIYGDNGSKPEGCPETCLEPDLPDYDPEPEHPTRDELVHEVKQLKEENAYLRGICSRAEQRLNFALDAFRTHPFNQLPPRPPFRDAPEPKEAKDARDTNRNKTSFPSINDTPISTSNIVAEPQGEAPTINPQKDRLSGAVSQDS